MKKKKIDIFNTMFGLCCVFSVISIIAAIIDVCTQEELLWVTHIRNGTLILILLCLVVSIVSLLRVMWPMLLKWCKTWSVILWVTTITLTIPCVTHFLFFRGETIDQQAWLSAYTEYLSFFGAFALGYFLYKREEMKSHTALKKKARLMYEAISNIQNDIRHIENFINRGEILQIPENWRSDYLDIKRLVTYDEPGLSNELEYFFGIVGAINKAITEGKQEKAKKIYLDFEQSEKYRYTTYNYMEAAIVLLYISADLPQRKPWKEEEKKQIEKYAEEFFPVVNLWIYNFLIKNHLSSCDFQLIEADLVEWLLKQPKLSAWVKYPYEKRKITAVIFSVALAMKSKSLNLNYCWGQFKLK